MAYFLYRSWIGAAALLPIGVFWFCRKKQEQGEKRRQELKEQFREMLLSIAGSLQAGYSVENAFREARNDMLVLYGGSADIVHELSALSQALENHIPVEKILSDFAARSGVGEIEDFAQVFMIGKRSGADMGDMIGHTVRLISEKMETAREIRTVMSAKVMEQRVMSIVPFGIMGYIGITSPGFFDALYHNPAGILFMSSCLIWYLGCYAVAQHIVRIEV